jgi:hypothetical protein
MCCFFSCRDKQHIEGLRNIEVYLNTENKNSPFGVILKPLSLMDSSVGKLKGVNKDSCFIGYLSFIDKKDMKSLYSKNKISETFYNNDESTIYCLTGYKNGEQFYILDLNKNKNFGDDKIIELDKELKYKTSINYKARDSFEFFNTNVFKFYGNNIYEDEVCIRVYPDANYFSYNKISKEQKFRNDLRLVFQFKDYLYGSFLKGGIEY